MGYYSFKEYFKMKGLVLTLIFQFVMCIFASKTPSDIATKNILQQTGEDTTGHMNVLPDWIRASNLNNIHLHIFRSLVVSELVATSENTVRIYIHSYSLNHVFTVSMELLEYGYTVQFEIPEITWYNTGHISCGIGRPSFIPVTQYVKPVSENRCDPSHIIIQIPAKPEFGSYSDFIKQGF